MLALQADTCEGEERELKHAACHPAFASSNVGFLGKGLHLVA